MARTWRSRRATTTAASAPSSRATVSERSSTTARRTAQLRVSNGRRITPHTGPSRQPRRGIAPSRPLVDYRTTSDAVTREGSFTCDPLTGQAGEPRTTASTIRTWSSNGPAWTEVVHHSRTHPPVLADQRGQRLIEPLRLLQRLLGQHLGRGAAESRGATEVAAQRLQTVQEHRPPFLIRGESSPPRIPFARRGRTVRQGPANRGSTLHQSDPHRIPQPIPQLPKTLLRQACRRHRSHGGHCRTED